MTAAPRIQQRGGFMLVASEVALVLLSLAAVAQFNRLFGDNEWARPLVVTTILAHGVAIAMRRLGRGLMLAGLASLVMMVLTTAWYHYWSTTIAGIPTGDTRAAVDVDLSAAWNLFGDVKAPTDTTTGFLLMATLAIWIGAYLADWAAFRLWSSIEAFIPSLSIVIFVAFFAVDERMRMMTGIFICAALLFLLLHRVAKQSMESRWLGDRATVGTAALLRAGTVLAVIGVLAAVLVGPNVPGADAEALVELNNKGGDGPSSRTVISPIVDIRGRLVDQKDVEVFTVRSDEKTYWRLTSLPVFDGRVWGSRGSYSEASGSLPVRIDSGTTDVSTRAEIVIRNLGAVWMPTPFEPRAISGASSGAISYEPDSATLIVDKELENSDGISYTIEAALPRFDPAVLRDIPEEYPQDILDEYTQLPDDFSPTAIAEAFRITEGAVGPYEKALALQNFFRDNFIYDLEVGPGHSSAQIDNFLELRRGYCEQFAGSYAAMARAIGLPARVAVGFTWGDQDPNDPTLWRVRGEHAHAWPEVFMPTVGWVSFEPTPSRGAPGAEQWTNVPEQQAGSQDDPAPLPTETPVNPNENPPEQPTPRTFPETEPEITQPTVAAPTEPTDRVPNWLEPILWGLAALSALGLLYVGIVLGLQARRREKRHRLATTNRQRLHAVWVDAEDALMPLGIRREQMETDTEFAVRAKHDAPLPGNALEVLGQATTLATFSPSEPEDELIDRSRRLQKEIEETVVNQTSSKQRLKDRLHPRHLITAWR